MKTPMKWWPLLAIACVVAAVGSCSKMPSHWRGHKAAIKREPPFYGYRIGLASYTFRQFTFEQAIVMTKELGLNSICLKERHLPLDSTPEECHGAARKVHEAGLILTGGGVVNLRHTTPTQMRAIFEYAKNAQMPVLTISPTTDTLPMIDKLVREYNIKVAIHNHGPEDLFPSPVDAYEAVRNLDKRIGICIDIGHSVRNGDDEIIVIHKVADRLYDFHLKDVDRRVKAGKTVVMGQGVIRLPEVFKALEEVGYNGPLNLEYEPEGNNPMPALKQNVQYIKEMLAKQYGGAPAATNAP